MPRPFRLLPLSVLAASLLLGSARQAADATARGFDCGKDKVQAFGHSGRAIELALRR